MTSPDHPPSGPEALTASEDPSPAPAVPASGHCCAPSPRPAAGGAIGDTVPDGGPIEDDADSPGRRPPAHDDVPVPGGSFLMGDAHGEGYPGDGDDVVHPVRLTPFRIDATTVTNRMFAAFVEATGYRTDAERFGSSAVFHLLVDAPRSDLLRQAAGAPWWFAVRGADWAHPHGARSHWRVLPDHPAVHVSHADALAYCAWAARRLPTEAEWECAARGGLTGKRYAWGDDLIPHGEHRCNIWQGIFPTVNTGDDGYVGAAPVRSFPPNGYGLYEVAGNVWEWCADWFAPDYYGSSPTDDPAGPPAGETRVMRGGSYLCHRSYCDRYRVAARTSNTPDSSSGNCGFRTVAV